MATLTQGQITTFLIVLSAIIAAAFTLDKVIDLIKKWRQPSVNIQDKLAADKTRLEMHEKQIIDLTKMVNALCKAEVAHLTFELTGGNTDKLQEALTSLTNSTIDRLN